jgi:hypothetical protein
MKYLRILVLVGIALLFGSVASHASTFHAGALDPSCNASVNPTECGFGFTDIGQSTQVGLSETQCTAPGIQPPLTGLPTDGTLFGCFLGNNDTGEAITSITLHFLSIQGVTGCDTDLPEGTTPQIFANNSCNVDPSGGFDLTFSGGPGVPNGGFFVILEEGVAPGDFTGMTTVFTATPEPDSLLLLSTGVMMSGLYFARRQRLFAFLKK